MKNGIYIKIAIKIIVIFLLWGCLFRHPYSYYQIVRLVTFSLFVIHAIIDYKENNLIGTILAGAIALLFNPITKIAFKRDTWQQIDEVLIYLLTGWIVVEVGVFLYYRKWKLNK